MTYRAGGAQVSGSPVGREAAAHGPAPRRRAVESHRRRCTAEAFRARYTLRVATAGGTAAARLAGPNTESCPSSHNAIAPTGR